MFAERISPRKILQTHQLRPNCLAGRLTDWRPAIKAGSLATLSLRSSQNCQKSRFIFTQLGVKCMGTKENEGLRRRMNSWRHYYAKTNHTVEDSLEN